MILLKIHHLLRRVNYLFLAALAFSLSLVLDNEKHDENNTSKISLIPSVPVAHADIPGGGDGGGDGDVPMDGLDHGCIDVGVDGDGGGGDGGGSSCSCSCDGDGV